MTNNNSINDRVQSVALTSTALEKRLLNVDTITQIILTKDLIARTLAAKGKQYNSFDPSGLLEFPKTANAVRAIGMIAVTATFMLNKECNDFVFCNEDMATAIHPKIESSKFYRFLHGGLIDSKDPSKGTDLLIKPDGMVCTLFDADTEDCASDEIIIKRPRTSEELRAERVSKEVKEKLAGNLNYSIFPHLTNKSYYSSNAEAAEELEMTRHRVARALARSNPKAAQGQICQALILGFVSHFHVMSSMYYDSLKRQAKGEGVKTAPLGLGIYMPAWTILSKDIIRPISGELDKLRGLTGYGGHPVVVSRKAMYKSMGLPMPKPQTDISTLLKDDTKLVNNLEVKPLKELMNEIAKTPDEIDVVNPDSPIEENIKHDCEPEKEAETVNLIQKQAMDRRRKKQVTTDPLGLSNLPPAPSNSSGTSAPEEKKAVPPKTTRRRPMLSADDEATLG